MPNVLWPAWRFARKAPGGTPLDFALLGSQDHPLGLKLSPSAAAWQRLSWPGACSGSPRRHLCSPPPPPPHLHHIVSS